MRHVPALVLRELSTYFLRPTAYLVLLGFLAIAALDFLQLVTLLSDPRVAALNAGLVDPVAGYVAANGLFWVALLVAIPALTMRLMAEERRAGTLEGLLTAPVTEAQVVVAKWIAGVVMYVALLLPFALYLPFLVRFGGYPLAIGPLSSLGVGLASLGMMLVAVGLCFSAATRHQVEAAVATFVTLLALLLPPLLAEILPVGPQARVVLQTLSIFAQINDFAAGRLDPRVVALHLATAAVLLFLAVKITEAKRGL